MTRMIAACGLMLGLLGGAGCGDGSTPGASPVGPSSDPPPAQTPPPPPVPSTVTVNGMLTDTVSGALLAQFTQTVDRLPARVTLSHPGYVTRETWLTAADGPRVDLFPERGFDLAFYRQLVRDDLDKHPGAPFPLYVLPSAPLFFIEVDGAKGFSRQLAARLEAVARRVVPQLTGGRFQVTRWETGPTPRPRQQGWVVIERKDATGACGSAYIGALDGYIELGIGTGCDSIESVLAHELGHAFGFFHVSRPGSMMFPQEHHSSATDAPTDIERHHMALAYARRRGNRDIDVDPAP